MLCFMLPISHVRKPRLWTVTWLIQGHPGGKLSERYLQSLSAPLQSPTIPYCAVVLICNSLIKRYMDLLSVWECERSLPSYCSDFGPCALLGGMTIHKASYSLAESWIFHLPPYLQPGKKDCNNSFCLDTHSSGVSGIGELVKHRFRKFAGD